ncbi:MAG TPA: CotH kinase family protein, partial [Polyangiaceae bacterium]|nr:CotH kinase family protein [Polyangiaceae bacterium]
VHPSRGNTGGDTAAPPTHEPDAGPPSSPEDAGAAGDAAGPDAGDVPPADGLPHADTAPASLAVDVFGAVGNRYYLMVSDDQLERMNERYLGGGFPGGPFFGGDIYTPGGGQGGTTFVDHLFVSTPGAAPHTADFGKVQVKLVGESTGRPWTLDSLPNFKIDSDEFTAGNRIGGVKHLRLNNAVVGSIFREKLTLELYAALGYPAPRATYAWVQSSVWGPDIDVPYIAVEAYKPAFCKQREAQLGGGCVNMWEFAGDLGYGQLGAAESCQFSECDPTRALELELDAVQTPPGAGYKDVMSEWIDWDAFHRFQCLSWILATGDDALHNSNNFVLVERADGKFQHLPYSIDISLGQEWYPEVPLAGSSVLARGCQSDPACWEDLLTTCEGLVQSFIDVDPVAMLDATLATLETGGMLRDGDEGRYRALSSYLARRIVELPIELQANRDQGPPVDAYCEYPWILCGNACALPEECPFCEPQPEPEPQPGVDAGAGADGDEADGDEADGPAPDEPRPVDPPGVPAACLPPIDLYDVAPAAMPR